MCFIILFFSDLLKLDLCADVVTATPYTGLL